MKPVLTIGMATYDDYDGVYFTVQSIRLHHPEVTEVTEIVVIDNHPDGPCGTDLKSLQDWVTGYRYIPWSRTSGTSVRDLVFREASGDFVLCVDSHGAAYVAEVVWSAGGSRGLVPAGCHSLQKFVRRGAVS